MSVTNDLKAAIRTAHAADGTLNGLVPSARLTFGTQGGRPALPYVDCEVAKGAETEQIATGGGIVHKKVTFTIVAATEADASAVVNAIVTLFSAGITIANTTMNSWLYDEDESRELPEKKDGANVYEATVSYAVMLGRAAL